VEQKSRRKGGAKIQRKRWSKNPYRNSGAKIQKKRWIKL
jgi:hypothetical protein